MWRRWKTPLISKPDHFEDRSLWWPCYRPCYPPVAAAVEENGCGILPRPWLILFFYQDYSSHWFEAAAATKNWFAARAIPLITDPPFLPNFADFFLFPKVSGYGSAEMSSPRRLPPRSATGWSGAKVCTYRRWPYQEKLRNKVCSIVLIFCFTNTFWADLPYRTPLPPPQRKKRKDWGT